MMKLTQKSMKFYWGEKAEPAFQLLKQKLCSALILTLPEGSENFVVYYDASHKGLGAVLMQKEKVIAYASCQLKVYIPLLVIASESFRYSIGMSIAYHPQADGQSDRTIETLKDMLCACVLDFRKVRIDICRWYNFRITTVTIQVLRLHHLRHYIGVSVDHLSAGLKLETVSSLAQRSSTKQLRRSFKSRVVFKFPEILKRARFHSTFHVPNLKKCLSNKTLAILFDEIQDNDKLYFIEEPIEIMDREIKLLKQFCILIVKVCWNSRIGHELTWEREDQIKKKYPHLFAKSALVVEITS
nr:putative reverse transcriptase domain-containing protein [Tanacetum cinerariifolium]